eukprot:COSAG06_NODE_9481_length_1889_cov_3.913408_2_plen_205_part_00
MPFYDTKAHPNTFTKTGLGRQTHREGNTHNLKSLVGWVIIVLSCLVLSCVALSCLVLSCLVLRCLVLSCLVLRCLVLSYLVLSCLVLSCLVLRCLVLSCLVLSCVALSCLVLSYLVLSCLALSCLVLGDLWPKGVCSCCASARVEGVCETRLLLFRSTLGALFIHFRSTLGACFAKTIALPVEGVHNAPSSLLRNFDEYIYKYI